MGLKFSDNLKKMMYNGETSFSLDKNGSNNYFRIPGNDDLNYSPSSENTFSNSTIEKVREYVDAHTSGVKANYDLSDEGSMIVTFPRFIEMINNGYNIYESEVINKDLVSIRFQKEVKRQGMSR